MDNRTKNTIARHLESVEENRLASFAAKDRERERQEIESDDGDGAQWGEQ